MHKSVTIIKECLTKIQKLKRKPILFFRDAFKNIYRSSNRKGDRA